MTNTFDDIVEHGAIYFVIGSNTTEQHPVLGMRLRQAVKRRGAKLIVADPRRIPLTDYAVLHLRLRPGTNIALLNGIMHVLIAEDLYDKAYVQERTEGFEELKAVVATYTPERAAEITGVPAEDIVKAARLLASHKPGALIYAMGITQHTTGHQNVISCANLQMLLGNVGVPGGGVNPLRGQNNVQGACDMGALPDLFPAYQAVVKEEVRRKFEAAWGVPLSPEVGLTVVEMMHEAEAGRVRALYIMGENPMLSDPDVNHVQRALETVDFLVVQDIFLTETAALADVVLPSLSWAEKLGTFTNTERRVQLVRPAVPPPGEAKPDWWIIGEIARRMGFAGLTYDSPREIMEEVNRVAPSYAGITYDRIGEQGLQWPCPNPEHPGTPILHVGKFTRGLGRLTPAEWEPPAEQTDDEYPMVFTTGRVLYHYHTRSMTGRSAGLEAIYPEPMVEINPEDAAALGIADGDRVRLTSRRGQVTVRAQVTPIVDKGVVFMAFHFAEAAANKLTIAALDPVAKIPQYKVCAVRVEREEPLPVE